MSRLKKGIKVKVGIFVLVGAIILFAYIILLGENQTLFNLTSKYKVKFTKVNGLFTGSVVTVNGVPAGNVIAINFIHETGNYRQLYLFYESSLRSLQINLKPL